MSNKFKLIKLYNHYIYERSSDLIRSKPISEWDYYDLSKIFEYYTCIHLSEQTGKPFYEYDDINPSFKEDNRMSKQDTGIDASDLDKSIVQCKLRTNNLSLKECCTFFASQIIMCKETKKPIIRWENMILSRNSESKLSEHLQFSKDEERFEDITFETKEVLNYCQYLLNNPPIYNSDEDNFVELRDYQNEAIDIIQKNNNSIICIPTGCGKNVIIIHSMLEKKKYLILVPRIILMEQIKEEIIRFRPNLKNKIQCIGDSSKTEVIKKDIVICVYNSIGLINIPFTDFEKIYIDEAHHINLPQIYYDVEDNIDDNEDGNEDSEDSYDSDNKDYNKESYIGKIVKLKEYKNNVYLSATIDGIDGFVMYKKEIREMIELGYISDYQIHIPIFNNDPDDKAICNHLIKNYRNIILYCSSQNEGKRINELMNKLMKGCSEYIDCNTNKKKRNEIIRKYKEGNFPFLVNVRILIEGFDAPITKGVCFMHLPSNKTTLIQIIGRSLRKHSDKTFANIILPFSNDKDENSINQFLKIMSLNDRRIKKSFVRKTIGGYISIEKNNESEESQIVENELELKYNLIFDNMGECLNGTEVWEFKLEKVKKYMDENDKRPSSKNIDKEIKKLGKWIEHQNTKYKNKSFIMKNEEIYNKWTEFINDPKYSKYFLSNEEKSIFKLEDVKKYIDDNNKRPSQGDDNKEIIRMARWVQVCEKKCKNKSFIIKNEGFYTKWIKFINDPKYSKYFLTREEDWILKLEETKRYIDNNNKRPSQVDFDEQIKTLGHWTSNQLKIYKKKSEIMKNEEIYNKWIEFINDSKYSIYFLSNEEVWNMKLEEVKKYIDDNNKKPSSGKDSNDKIKQLGNWIGHQLTNYKNKSQIMTNEEIYKKWTEFINDPKYSKHFLTEEDNWIFKLEEVKKYIDNNNKRPSGTNKNEEIQKLGSWIYCQTEKYKKKVEIMTNEEIYKNWTEFINDPKYSKHFLSNEEKWNMKLEKVKEYIDDNNKRPSGKNKNDEIQKLSSWISDQLINYKQKSRKRIMSNEEIRKKWTDFINDPKYSKYF